MTPARIKGLLLIFLYTMVADIIIVINQRAVSQGNLWLTGLSDFVLGTTGFLLFKKLAKDEEGEGDKIGQWLAYSLGGVAGGIAGVLISIHLFGV
jgi:hypothetical protein